MATLELVGDLGKALLAWVWLAAIAGLAVWVLWEWSSLIF
jgi:hypothetical protein